MYNMRFTDFSCIGIGTDIEEIKRFENYEDSSLRTLLIKNFTQKELDYCLSREYPAQHLAARFAGKESVIKALNSLNIKNVFFRSIEIVNNKWGVPSVRINKRDGKK